MLTAIFILVKGSVSMKNFKLEISMRDLITIGSAICSMLENAPARSVWIAGRFSTVEHA